MAYNKEEHLRDNIEALRIAFTVEDPTPEQRVSLSKYSGFGGLKCVLYSAASDEDISDPK